MMNQEPNEMFMKSKAKAAKAPQFSDGGLTGQGPSNGKKSIFQQDKAGPDEVTNTHKKDDDESSSLKNKAKTSSEKLIPGGDNSDSDKIKKDNDAETGVMIQIPAKKPLLPQLDN